MALPGLLGPDARLQRLPSWFPVVGNQKAPGPGFGWGVLKAKGQQNQSLLKVKVG